MWLGFCQADGLLQGFAGNGRMRKKRQDPEQGRAGGAWGSVGEGSPDSPASWPLVGWFWCALQGVTWETQPTSESILGFRELCSSTWLPASTSWGDAVHAFKNLIATFPDAHNSGKGTMTSFGPNLFCSTLSSMPFVLQSYPTNPHLMPYNSGSPDLFPYSSFFLVGQVWCCLPICSS